MDARIYRIIRIQWLSGPEEAYEAEGLTCRPLDKIEGWEKDAFEARKHEWVQVEIDPRTEPKWRSIWEAYSKGKIPKEQEAEKDREWHVSGIRAQGKIIGIHKITLKVDSGLGLKLTLQEMNVHDVTKKLKICSEEEEDGWDIRLERSSNYGR